MADRFITRLGLHNFLSFAKQPATELGALNIFVGRNSSGKSTVLHALALLSSTLEDPSPDTSFLFSGSGLNLGTFPDVVHGNNRKRSFGFELSVDSSQVSYFSLATGRRRDAETQVPDTVKVFFKEDQRTLRPYLSALSVYSNQGNRYFTLQGRAGGGTPGYRSAGVAEVQQRVPFMPPRISRFLPSFEFDIPRIRELKSGPSEADMKRVAHFQAVESLSQHLAAVLGNLTYIGPSRAPIDAAYFPRGSYPHKPNSNASNLVPWILGQTRRKTDLDHFHRTLNLWLHRRMGLVNESRLREFVEGYAFRLEGRDTDVNASVTLSNTGYGVSQVLPVVAVLALSSPCILAIEQPELHLHPGAQAVLADLLLEFVSRGFQLLVETHSEHLIYRLRALLASGAAAEKGIEASDIRLFHVEKNRAGSKLRPVQISQTGELRGWPRGFFSASSNDLMVLLQSGGGV